MTAPAWARGYDPALLSDLAALFAAHDEGLTLSPFTKVNEAAIAGWIDAGRVDFALPLGGGASAAVAWRRVKQREKVKDFAGETMATMKPGDICVWRFAGPESKVVPMLRNLEGRTLGLVFAHAWQERPGDRVIMGDVGAGWQGTKIRASSELIGFYALGSVAARERPADRPALAQLSLPRLEVGPLAAALPRLDALWADHYSSYNARNSWSALALRGYGGLSAFIEKPAEMSKKWKSAHADEMLWELADTPIRRHLPEAEPLIAAIPGRKDRIRLMRLAPGGGELRRHADITDPDAGTRNGCLMRIHVPVVTNDAVVFEGWRADGTREQARMAAGEPWYLDTRKPHTAVNGGASERVHLVMDVEASRLRELIV